MKFQKGVSGNPKGRPKRGMAMADALRKVLALKTETGEANAEAIARKLVSLALMGNVLAIREIYDRIDGKVGQPLEHAGKGGAPLLDPSRIPTSTIAEAMQILENISANGHGDSVIPADS